MAQKAAKLKEIMVEGLKRCALHMRGKIFSQKNWAQQQFFQIINFGFQQFWSPLSDRDAQYLIWKSLQMLNGIPSSQ